LAEFQMSMGQDLLVPPTDYINAGVHIGTKVSAKEMKRFVKLQAADGLNLIDVDKLDLRLRVAAKALARQQDTSKVVIVSSKEYGAKPVEKFCEYTNFKAIVRRFPPGIFSNPVVSYYWPTSLLMVADPKVDEKAIVEASLVRVPVIAVCDTDNSCENIDLIIPANNKGRKSLALIFWILAREISRLRGTIPPKGDLPEPASAFEYPVEEVEVAE
jgi:small subunit ribosomal protein S2